MLIVNKRSFSIGALLAASFGAVLFVAFQPIFGDGRDGLQFSDDLFNSLAKGSSYFVPKVRKASEPFKGTPLAIAVRVERLPARVQSALAAAGASVKARGSELTVGGDLGSLLERVLDDSDAMFRNDGAALASRYGFDAREVMTAWWHFLRAANWELKKQKRLAEAAVVSEVMRKAVEPAFNFYGIHAQRVADSAGVMTGLLVFYVAFTVWWGFAIYFLFEGFGVSMKKPKGRKEAKVRA